MNNEVPKIPKHVHEYVRVKVKRTGRIFFKCSLPGCVHNIDKELAIGRFCRCYKCGEIFTLDNVNTKLAKPHCDSCTIGRSSNKQTVIVDETLIRKMMLS